MSSPHYSKDSQIATANANSDGSQYRQIQQRPSSLSLPSLGYHSAGTAANGDTFDGNHRGGYATAPSTPSVASTRCFHYSLGSGEDQQSAPPGRPSSGGPTSSTASTTSTALPKEKEKARRTKSGCLTCRRRRVKCDEAHPICNRCTIAKQDCVYPDPSLALSKAAQRAAARNGSVAPTVMSAGSSAPSSGNGSAKRVRKGGTGVITDRPSTSAKLSDPKEHEHDPSTRPGSRSHSPITTTSVPIQGPSEHRGSLSLPSMSAFFQPVEYPTPFGSAPLAPFAHPLRPSNYASLQTGSHSSTSVPPSHPADGGAVPLHFDSLFHTENATAYRTNSANERDSIEELRKRFQGGEGDDDDAGTGFGPAESGPSSAINNLDAIWTDPEYLSRMLESLRGTSIGRDDAFLNMLGDQQDRVDSHSQLQIAEGGDYFDAAGAPSGAGLVLSNPTAAPLSVPAGAETGPDDKTGVATGTTTADPAQRRYLAAYDFSPQPAIDPILAASSSLELHRQAANRDKAVPSLQELGLGPPPVLAGATFTGQLKDWTVPANMEEAMKGMPVQRHAELLRHYFVNIVGLFNPIDHAKNPFRTFVAEHVADSLCLLHAVLALSAINQQPHSVEARAESMLYFEASVDLYVRSLQQQDDIGLFTLLLLSLYSVFDAGTTQPQHFSQRAQGVINARFDLLSAPEASQRTGASADFRFLVRLHVVYEVLANLSRRPGDLRSVSSGKYTLSTLLQIIEQWDQEEERRAGLSGFNYEDYTMTGLLGIPTFFVSLLNEITQLKEEQHALRLQEVAASLPVEGDGQVQMSAGGAKDEEGEHTTANPPAPPSPTEVRAAQSKLTQKIRDLESKIQFARPGRLLLPPSVAREAQVHRAVSVRFFDLFRLGTSIHLLLELHEVAPNDQAIQARVGEIVNLLGNIEQNSNYNTSAIFAFFIAGAVATSQNDRSVLYRRLDSTWNSPAGNIWSLRSIMDEVWQRNSERLEAGEPCHSWKDVAQARRWTLLIM